jgi:hypothetical protein
MFFVAEMIKNVILGKPKENILCYIELFYFNNVYFYIDMSYINVF